MRTQRKATTLIALAAALLLAGCSRFNHDWDAAAVAPPPTNDITGRWIGTWQNENNDHSGKLRAIITRIDDEHVRAQYRAIFAAIIPFESEVVLQTAHAEGGQSFSGEADLGKSAGGIYTYSGHASPDEFFSSYTSESNSGTYTLARPE